jgi:hypothetical protein
MWSRRSSRLSITRFNFSSAGPNSRRLSSTKPDSCTDTSSMPAIRLLSAWRRSSSAANRRLPSVINWFT